MLYGMRCSSHYFIYLMLSKNVCKLLQKLSISLSYPTVLFFVLCYNSGTKQVFLFLKINRGFLTLLQDATVLNSNLSLPQLTDSEQYTSHQIAGQIQCKA